MFPQENNVTLTILLWDLRYETSSMGLGIYLAEMKLIFSVDY